MSNFTKKKKVDVKVPRCCGHKMKFGLLDMEEKPTKKSLYEDYKKKMNGEETTNESSSLDGLYAYSCPYCGKSVLAKESGELLSQEESEGLFSDKQDNQLPEGVTEEMIKEALIKEHPELAQTPVRQHKVILNIDVPIESWNEPEDITLCNTTIHVSKAMVYKAEIPLDDFIPEIMFKSESVDNEDLLPYAYTEGNEVWITAKNKLQDTVYIDSLVFWTLDEYKRIEAGEDRVEILNQVKDSQNNN